MDFSGGQGGGRQWNDKPGGQEPSGETGTRENKSVCPTPRSVHNGGPQSSVQNLQKEQPPILSPTTQTNTQTHVGLIALHCARGGGDVTPQAPPARKFSIQSPPFFRRLIIFGSGKNRGRKSYPRTAKRGNFPRSEQREEEPNEHLSTSSPPPPTHIPCSPQ